MENLQPTTTYDLRFASKNLVGFSEWGAGKQLTMPQRGPPEKPRINTLVCETLETLIPHFRKKKDFFFQYYAGGNTNF